MLAREATKADIQAVRDRLREAKEQRQLDIQINQAIALVNRNHRRKKYDTERLSAGSSSHSSWTLHIWLKSLEMWLGISL